MRKFLPQFKYPKFLLLLITFLVAYLLFYGRNFPSLNNFIISSGYFGAFLAGIMYSYGFTAAPATSIFLILAKHQNIYAAALIGGLGALLSDLVIFSLVRVSFADEVEKLSKEKIFVNINNRMPNVFKKYLFPVLAGFIIASPLPDEIGVPLMAAVTSVSTKVFFVMSYILNTTGIFAIFVIGNIIK